MEPFKTSDLSLAAYLIYKEFRIASIENDPTHERKKLFIFERKTGYKIEDKVDEFHRRQGSVEPQRYFNCTKELKNRIYG